MPITEKQTVCVNSGFAHPADTTKQVQFDMSGITANTPAVIAVPAASGTMAYTESGTVTMTAACGTSGTITLANNTLTYNKIGNTVFFSGVLDVGSVSSPLGTLTLNGLPYASGNNNRNAAGVALFVQGGFASSLAGNIVQAIILKNTTGIIVNYVSQTAGTVGSNMAGVCQGGTSFTVSGSYHLS